MANISRDARANTAALPSATRKACPPPVRSPFGAVPRYALPPRFLVIFQCGEVNSVSKRHRSFLLASLLPILLGSVFAVVQAQNAGAPAVAVTQTRWSDPATWPERKVPAAGDKVTIARDQSVLLDVSPPVLGSLTIDGKLSFANNADLELT